MTETVGRNPDRPEGIARRENDKNRGRITSTPAPRSIRNGLLLGHPDRGIQLILDVGPVFNTEVGDDLVKFHEVLRRKRSGFQLQLEAEVLKDRDSAVGVMLRTEYRRRLDHPRATLSYL